MPISDRRVDDVYKVAFLKVFMYQLLQSFYSKYHSLKPIMLFLFLFLVAYLFTLFQFNNKYHTSPQLYYSARSVSIQSPWAFHHDSFTSTGQAVSYLDLPCPFLWEIIMQMNPLVLG